MVNCFIKDTCKIFNSEEDSCPYENSEVKPCMRQYKINYLLDQALLSDAQKIRKALLLDVNKIWAESSLTCRVLFINVPKFLLALKASISNQSDYIDHINMYVNSADIVIWDDIGTKVATEFEHEHLLSLIDSRLLDNKSNIFTSNIIPNELSSFVGDRLASRIINTSKTIEFLGTDKRGLKLK